METRVSQLITLPLRNEEFHPPLHLSPGKYQIAVVDVEFYFTKATPNNNIVFTFDKKKGNVYTTDLDTKVFQKDEISHLVVSYPKILVDFAKLCAHITRVFSNVMYKMNGSNDYKNLFDVKSDTYFIKVSMAEEALDFVDSHVDSSSLDILWRIIFGIIENRQYVKNNVFSVYPPSQNITVVVNVQFSGSFYMTEEYSATSMSTHVYSNWLRFTVTPEQIGNKVEAYTYTNLSIYCSGPTSIGGIRFSFVDDLGNPQNKVRLSLEGPPLKKQIPNKAREHSKPAGHHGGTQQQ